MVNPFKEIYKYNKDRGLIDKGYSNTRECAFPIEEALEGFDLTSLTKLVVPLASAVLTPKELSRQIIKTVADEHTVINPVDQLDKHLDILVYTLGSIFKMGLTPQETMNALSIVVHSNSTKSNEVDSQGKNIKGGSWGPPEVKLQALLDKVGLKE